MFVFKKEKRLVFFNLIKMDPNTKMVMVVQKTPKDKITIVQQIAVNLGINKKDFYLTDSIDPQSLYNVARNIEIAAWKLSTSRDVNGHLYLVTNEINSIGFVQQEVKMESLF